LKKTLYDFITERGFNKIAEAILKSAVTNPNEKHTTEEWELILDKKLKERG